MKQSIQTKRRPTLMEELLQIDREYEDTLLYISHRLTNGKISQHRFNQLLESLRLQSQIDEEDVELSHGYDITRMKHLFGV